MVYQPSESGICIVGLMLVRNEDWILGASLRAALEWCDKIVITLDRCTDKSVDIVTDIQKEIGRDRVIFEVRGGSTGFWDEMNVRHENLLLGRKYGGNRFVIVDADEILTANCLPHMKHWLRTISPGQLLELPMIPVWDSIDLYRSDPCVWSRARITLGWRDNGEQGWKAREDGYQHHARAPYGVIGPICQPITAAGSGGHPGGVMHLQFCNRRRLVAKHVLYRMVDHLRWPGRRTPEKLNSIYDEALAPAGTLTKIPDEWWGTYRKDLIDINGVPWQEKEIVRLLNANGLKAFEGLDLKGFSA